ncbi:MAG: hypothetical protein ACI9MR_001625 [Myxococcota bacterium]|jgi:hypothetical protein
MKPVSNLRLLAALFFFVVLTAPAYAAPQGEPGDDPVAVSADPASDGFGTLTPEEIAGAVEALNVRIEAMRGKVIMAQLVKLEAKAETRFDIIAEVLGWFSMAGLLLLLLPLWLRRRYPGQMKQLFGYSAIAAFTFVAVMLVFSALILTFKGLQSVLAPITNPVLQLTNGAFDALLENVNSLGASASLLLDAPLTALESGTADGVSMALMQNAGSLFEDAETFLNLASALSWVKDILGVLPVLLALIVVLLFLLSLKDVIKALVTLPQQAIDGDSTAGETIRKVGARLRAEFVVSLLLLLVFAIVTIISAVAMTMTAEPAAEALVGYTMLNTLYLAVEPGASTLLVYASVGSALVFVVLALISSVVASVLFIGKTQKVLLARFVDQVPLKTHARFFKLGSLSLLWALTLPLIFIYGAEMLSETLLNVESEGDVTWGWLLGSAPLLLVGGFVLVYWGLRGLRAQRFLFKYSVKPEPEQVAAAA